jgi:hypothetical protein
MPGLSKLATLCPKILDFLEDLIALTRDVGSQTIDLLV